MAFYGGGEFDSLTSGLRDLRSGSLFEILSIVILLIAFIPLFTMVPLAGPMAPRMMPLAGLMITQIFFILGIALIAVILAILSFYKFYKAASHFKEYDPSRLGIGKTGVLLIIIAIILIIVAGAVLAGSFATSFSSSLITGPSHTPMGPANIGGMGMGLIGAAISLLLIVIIAGILALIGSIFFGIMVMRLGEIENVEPGFKTAGIIYIVSVVLSLIPYIAIVGFILSIISLVMMYSYSGKSLEKLGVP